MTELLFGNSYWHSLEKAIKKDKSVNELLKINGYNVLRLLEIEIKNNMFKDRINMYFNG